MNVTHFPCGPAANESEAKARSHIEDRLRSTLGDETWILLTNLTFSVTHQLQSDEIDIVAIGPPGVRVIEVKHWTPQWVSEHQDFVEREADRATMKAKKIGTTLRKSVPALGHVEATILLTRESPKAKQWTGPPIRGVTIRTLNQWKDAIGLGLGSSPGLRPSVVAQLSRRLEPKSRVALDGSLRRFAGFVNLELQTPKDERFHRIYWGVHASTQDPVILHLYDLSASNDSNPEAKARREHDALHRLQLHEWAPRILDSYQEAPGYAGEMYFFTVVNPAAPSIRKRSSDDSWATPTRLAFSRSAVRALSELHHSSREEAPIVHRNLNTDTLLVGHDNMPILTGFQIAKLPSKISVASSGVPPTGWGPAVAPEVRSDGLHAARHSSDVYSLCASLIELFEGPDADQTSQQVVELLKEGMTADPKARIALDRLDSELGKMLGESPPPAPPPPARYWTEGQVVPFRDRKYRVVTRLGAGGVGTTFKVVELDRATKEDRGTYVAKVAHDQETGGQTIRAYSLARSHLGRHPTMSAIFEVVPEWRENEFTALMTWIDGAPLRDFTGVFPLLAEDQGEASGEALALRWLRQTCEALGVLHRNGLIHGDVSPSNLIVSGDDLVLTDYDFVAKISDPIDANGTVLYSAPSRQEGRTASPADDLFALAASFFHVLFDEEPFRCRDGIDKACGLNWDGIDRSEYERIFRFLDRATHPESVWRFGSVDEALDTLRQTGVVEVEPSPEAKDDVPVEPLTGPGGPSGVAGQRREQEVEWLKSLLQSYPGSRWGNRETRGLDSEFAKSTYVPTPFEDALIEDVRARRIRLVVLCGNAGDGKTALLQNLADRLGVGSHQSSDRILNGRTDDDLVVRMNLDGSASWQGKSADELLDEFMAPFQNGAPSEDIAHLLAINDGRLLEWINNHDTPLTFELSEMLDVATGYDQATESTGTASSSHIRFISLNQRSLVGSITPDGESVQTKFLASLVDRLYGGEEAQSKWMPCKTCSAQDRCEVFKAARIFGPEGIPGEPTAVRNHARERLFAAIQAVHLRGETHITVRELRAALVYILFGVHYCLDYHRGDDRLGSGDPWSYWDRTFSSESPGRQGELLRDLVRFDPALEAHPQIDRYLLGSLPSENRRPALPHHGLPLNSARRCAYFEWTTEEIEELTGEPDALGLATGRHLQHFRDLAIRGNVAERERLTKQLCHGISRLQALPPQALDRPDVVPLQISPRTPTETQFWVEKPIRHFRIEAEYLGGKERDGLDRLHREVLLIYQYQNVDLEERLRLGAELFHLLLELKDGYQLGDDSSDDTFAHLSIFVQRLVREDHRQLFAWSPLRENTVYRVSADPEQVLKGTSLELVQVLKIEATGEQSNAE